MKSSIKIIFLVMVSLLMSSICSFAFEQAEGEVQELGHGKFMLLDQNNVRRQFYQKAKVTNYLPSSWRPQNGDKVKLTFSQQKASFHMRMRLGQDFILVVNKVELVEKGPMTIDLKSPAKVEIIEVGRNKILVNLIEHGQNIRFTKTRKMQLIPAGWVPYPGEKALVTFRSLPSGFIIVHQADKVEKINE